VIVDYLQLMQGPGDVENRQQEISYTSRASPQGAGERAGCSPSSQSRSSRARPNSAAVSTGDHSSPIFASRSDRAGRDVVCFIYRQEFYDGPSIPRPNDSNRRHRRGDRREAAQRPDGLVKGALQKEYPRFGQLTRRARPG